MAQATLHSDSVTNSSGLRDRSLFMLGGYRREMFFVAKFLLTQPLKSQKLPNLKYQLKNKYPPLAKNFTKGYHSVVTHVLYHFCDMSLITACGNFLQSKVSCCLHMYFLWRQHICLPTNRKMIKIVTLIDSHIVLTYDC